MSTTKKLINLEALQCADHYCNTLKGNQHTASRTVTMECDSYYHLSTLTISFLNSIYDLSFVEDSAISSQIRYLFEMCLKLHPAGEMAFLDQLFLEKDDESELIKINSLSELTNKITAQEQLIANLEEKNTVLQQNLASLAQSE